MNGEAGLSSKVGAWDSHDPTYETVAFSADGVTLRGRLYASSSPELPAPAVVMSPGFATTVSGMGPTAYAEAFASTGLSVLLYDHYGFGKSDGEPRGEVEEWRQARSYISALTYLESVPEVDPERIAFWGASMSGRLALAAAAVDERVAALVVQMPGWGDESDGSGADDTAFEALRETLVHADLSHFRKTISGPMPVASPDQLKMPSFALPITAYRWFMEFGAAYGTGWENRATWVDLATPVPFDVRLCAPRIRIPTLAVTARHDEMPSTNADVARTLLAQMQGPTESLILEGGHFGAAYPGTDQFRRAIEVESAFLVRQLARPMH